MGLPPPPLTSTDKTKSTLLTGWPNPVGEPHQTPEGQGKTSALLDKTIPKAQPALIYVHVNVKDRE